jgi:hypothetical protein
MSMLVLHPRISTAIDWIAVKVFVAEGCIDVGDAVAVGVSELAAVGGTEVTTGVTEALNVGGWMISTVGVTIGGVPVGTGDSTGKG